MSREVLDVELSPEFRAIRRRLNAILDEVRALEGSMVCVIATTEEKGPDQPTSVVTAATVGFKLEHFNPLMDGLAQSVQNGFNNWQKNGPKDAES